MKEMSLVQFYSLLNKNNKIELNEDIYIKDSLGLIEKFLLFLSIISVEKPISFDGEFNGCGHTIYNLSAQFCEFVESDGIIRNVSVESKKEFKNSVICTVNEGTIQNIAINSTIVDSTGKIGGIAEKNHGVIKSCSFVGSIKHTSYDTGGIVSLNENVIKECTVCATIWGDCETGGIASTNKSGSIKGCTVTGRVRGRSNTAGIVALNTGDVSRCEISKITVTIDRPDIYTVGGIVAVNNGSVDSCTCGNDVYVKGDKIVGGIVGENLSRIRNSTVKSDVKISGKKIIGGVSGQSLESSIVKNVLVQDCYVSGEAYVGGITGRTDSTHENVVSDSKVDGSKRYGLLFGNLKSGSDLSDCYTVRDSEMSLVGSTADSVSTDSIYKCPNLDSDTIHALCLT